MSGCGTRAGGGVAWAGVMVLPQHSHPNSGSWARGAFLGHDSFPVLSPSSFGLSDDDDLPRLSPAFPLTPKVLAWPHL